MLWFDTYSAGVSLLCSAMFESIAIVYFYGKYWLFIKFLSFCNFFLNFFHFEQKFPFSIICHFVCLKNVNKLNGFSVAVTDICTYD